MQFNVEELYQINTKELRTFFATIPIDKNQITFKGKFQSGLFGSSHVAQTLIYLPKHVTFVLFEVEYCSFSRSYTEWDDSNYTHGTLYRSRTKTIYYSVSCIGDYLQTYVSSLPPSITSVQFNLPSRNQYRESRVSYDLSQILRNLPSTIKNLALKNFPLSLKIPYSIPSTLETLIIQDVPLGRLSYANQKSFFSAIPSVNHVKLVNINFDRMDTQSLRQFAEKLSEKIVHLDLGRNQLDQKSANELSFLLSLVSSRQALKSLGLSGNQLSTLAPQDLANALSCLSGNIEILDLGENGLLRLDDNSFRTIMEGLPRTLKRLRLSERGTSLSKEQLIVHFLSIPSHIEISFSYSNLLGLSVRDFVETLSWLPDTIETISLNGNDLGGMNIDDLVYLFTNLPPYVRKLCISHNFLARFKPAQLKTIFSTLSPSIIKLDITGNGFDRLPFSQLQDTFKSFPPAIKLIITGSANFKIRNDGAIVPCQELSPFGFLNEQKAFYYQAEFAKLRVVIMQIFAQIKRHCFLQSGKDFPPELFSYIFSFVFSSKEELKRFENLTDLISSRHPAEDITSEHEGECLAAVKQRIGKIQPTDIGLDLSRCGLNRLESENSQNEFSVILSELPDKITSLKLRGNGFLQTSKCQNVFVALMKKIPETITCLDLGANDFDYLSSEKLSELFLCLPQTIELVTLGHEEPITRELQIAKRSWPDSYAALTEGFSNEIEGSRVLLDDYTKGDSFLWCLLYGHWNRHHTAEVVRLVHFLDKGLIAHDDDLQYELEQINPTNKSGSLARRIGFLASRKPQTAADCLPEDGNEIDEEFEMISLSAGHQ